MSEKTQKYRPLARREPDGRIAVYVGASFHLMQEAEAVRLRDELSHEIAKVFGVPKELMR